MEQLPIEIDQTMDVRKSEVTEIVPTNFSKLGMYFIYYGKIFRISSMSSEVKKNLRLLLLYYCKLEICTKEKSRLNENAMREPRRAHHFHKHILTGRYQQGYILIFKYCRRHSFDNFGSLV